MQYTIQGDGQYRILRRAGGPMWSTDGIAPPTSWRVAILDSNAYGRVPLRDIALAANKVTARARCRERNWCGQTRWRDL